MILAAITIFILGILIGSFLNVCIYRIPRGEDIVVTRSHCMNCGYQLKWYDLVPVFSFIGLKGRCRVCSTKLSIQYPMIELLNGVIYVAIYVAIGNTAQTVLYCLLASALLVLSMIDWRTYEIPLGINLFIGALGVIRVFMDLQHWYTYVVGLFSVSSFMVLLIILSKGRAMGDGDAKLMAATGLLLGWKLNILAFVFGCILGSVIHLIRMKVEGESHQLAFGPYLAGGIIIAVLWGERLIQWYIGLL